MSASVSSKRNNAVAKPNAAVFRERTSGHAVSMLSQWVGEARAKEAAGRIATAISASAAASKNPDEFYSCTPASVAKVIAISALTGIMVSTGQGALAYAIPRRPRKGEDPQLQYQLSHRGIAALAKRAGLSLVAYPISIRDEIDTDEAGEVLVRHRDIDNPPMDEDDLRGVMVLTRSIETGIVLSRGWVAKSIINERRAASDSFCYAEKPGNDWAKQSSPWHKWYVEMAIKTALHYAIGRGWCVIDDTEAVRALQVDSEGDFTPANAVMLEDHTSQTDALTNALVGSEEAPSSEEQPAAEVVEVKEEKSKA